MGVLSSLKSLLQKKESRGDSTNSRKSSSSATNSFTMSSSYHSNDPTWSPTTSSKQANSDAGGYNYQYRDGRRYHAQQDVAYVLPNDDDEVDRVHQQHWIFRYAFQCNFHAPVTKMLEEGITVLDSGCGPATWTFEIGESYPRSKIYGVDASCVFPEDIKPANVEFAIGNIAKRIPYEDSMFDYVHQRLLFLGLTDEDWTNALKEHYRVLKPGGYIEMAEPDLSNMGKAGPALATLINTFQKGMESRGMRINSGAELEGRLREAGFENIVVKNLSIPVNHGGKIGELLWQDYRHAFMNVKPVLSKTNPEFENQEVYEAHLNKCGEEARRSQAHLGWYAVYAQKPVFSEQ